MSPGGLEASSDEDARMSQGGLPGSSDDGMYVGGCADSSDERAGGLAPAGPAPAAAAEPPWRPPPPAAFQPPQPLPIYPSEPFLANAYTVPG
eukprot:14622947-Heterocapsa_arctica.AAC.1